MVPLTRIMIGLAACAASLATVMPTASAGAEEPTAGAPHYLFFGLEGPQLCTSFVNWRDVSGMELINLDENTRLLAVEGKPDGEDFLRIEPDTQGTATPWDDTLHVTLTTYGVGPDELEELELPLYQTPGNGAINGLTTENVPKTLYLNRIEFMGHTSERNAVRNDSRVPMRAQGWFATIAAGEEGFLGGDGPDCVRANAGKNANKPNLIATRGGSDNIEGGWDDDRIDGGEGNDTIRTLAGNDILRGGPGVDHLKGEKGDDCYTGSHTDGLRDLLDETDTYASDLNRYAAEPGVIDGVEVETIEYITEAFPLLVFSCV